MTTPELNTFLDKSFARMIALLLKAAELCRLVEVVGCDKEMAQRVADDLSAKMKECQMVIDNAMVELLIRNNQDGAIEDVVTDILMEFVTTPDQCRILSKRISKHYPEDPDLPSVVAEIEAVGEKLKTKTA